MKHKLCMSMTMLFMFAAMPACIARAGDPALAGTVAEATPPLQPEAPSEPEEGPGLAIDEGNFPDKNLREYVKEYDDNENGMLEGSEKSRIKGIYLWNDSVPVSTLQGIELLPEITSLQICSSSMTTVDLSYNPNLEEVLLDAPLSSLDVSHNPRLKDLSLVGENFKLTTVDVSHNPELETLLYAGGRHKGPLRSLDISHNPKLKHLECQKNPYLNSLTFGDNDDLEVIYCWETGLQELDLSNLSNLTELSCKDSPELSHLVLPDSQKFRYLNCSNCNLKKLEMEDYPALEAVYCSDNPQLTSLTLKNVGELEEAECSNCDLTELDASDLPAFEYLDCSGNKRLRELKCSGDKLTELKISGCNALERVDCSNNQLAKVDVSGLKSLTYLDCSGNSLSGRAAVIGLSDKMKEEKPFVFTLTDELSGLNDAKCRVTLSKRSYTYNGKARKPSVTVKYDGKKLKEGTHYKVSYKNNVNAGTAIVKVSGIEKNGYKGNVEETFEINPGKPTLKSVKNKTRRSITVTWEMGSGADRYEIEYAANAAFQASVKKNAGKKKTKMSIGELEKGKTYYVRVAAFSKDGTTSSVSSSKKVKIKK